MTVIYAPGCEGYPLHLAIRQSYLKEATPADVKYKYLDGFGDSSPAKTLGTLAHKCLLEPEKFAAMRALPAGSRAKSDDVDAMIKAVEAICNDFNCFPDPLAPDAKLPERKAYLDACIANCQAAGVSFIDDADLPTISAIVNAVRAIPEARAMLDHPLAIKERTFVWRGPDGVVRQMTPDLLIPPCEACEGGAILDLKTTRCATDDAFGRDVLSYFYHWQAEWYSQGFQAFYGTRPDWYWLAVRSEPWHHAWLMSPPAGLLESAKQEYRPRFEALVSALATGNFPGYPARSMVLPLPSWKQAQLNRWSENE